MKMVSSSATSALSRTERSRSFSSRARKSARILPRSWASVGSSSSEACPSRWRMEAWIPLGCAGARVSRLDLHGLASERQCALLELRERLLLRLHLGADLRPRFLEREVVEELVQVVLGLHQFALAIGAVEGQEAVLHPARA